MDLHHHEFSVGIGLLLGALHALEPGHGKTALFTHLVAEKRSFLRPLILALSTAVTHAMSILLISLMVHQLLHSTIVVESHAFHRWLNLLSGISLLSLGLYILWSSREGRRRKFHIETELPRDRHGAECGCPSHRLRSRVWKSDQRTWKAVLIGFAVGLVPCPSALAALSAALVSRDLSMAVLIISMFSLGIFLSLALAGSLFGGLSTSFHSLSLLRKKPRLASQMQFVVFAITGIWHISLFVLA